MKAKQTKEQKLAKKELNRLLKEHARENRVLRAATGKKLHFEQEALKWSNSVDEQSRKLAALTDGVLNSAEKADVPQTEIMAQLFPAVPDNEA